MLHREPLAMCAMHVLQVGVETSSTHMTVSQSGLMPGSFATFVGFSFSFLCRPSQLAATFAFWRMQAHGGARLPFSLIGMLCAVIVRFRIELTQFHYADFRPWPAGVEFNHSLCGSHDHRHVCLYFGSGVILVPFSMKRSGATPRK